MEHLSTILLMSLFCCGWCLVISPGMLLSFFYEHFQALPYKMGKPLGLCVPCSASFVGTNAYLLLVVLGQTKFSVTNWIFYVVSCAYVNYLLWFLGKKMLKESK